MVGSIGCTQSVDDGADSVDIHLNPNSNVSVVASFKEHAATLARVVSTDGVHSFATPYVQVNEKGYGEIAVLGLAPETSYRHILELSTGNGVTTTSPIVLPTNAIPDGLSSMSVAITNGTGSPSTNGYWIVSGGAGDFTFAFDAAGKLRWYKQLEAAIQESKMQPDGTFTSYVGTSSGSQIVPGVYVRYTGSGTEIARISAASPDPTEDGAPTVYTDPHELLITVDDAGVEHHHLLAYVQRPFSDTDGTLASWHELLRQAPDGTVEFRWKSWSRFSAAYEDTAVTKSDVDVDHANAIAIDPSDGDYLVSFRSLSAVVKIDAQSGDVIWQLGGKQNQFTFVGDPLGGFQGQHSVRVMPNGNLMLYDNGQAHVPQESRAVEYKLDLAAKTATMVWQYRHTPAIFTNVTGSVERLANGNRLVAFAWAGVVDEVDRSGNVVWEASITKAGAPATLYRVRRLMDLYAYVAP
jgi:hypothetical protein